MTRSAQILFCLLLVACSASEISKTADTDLTASSEELVHHSREQETEIITTPPKPIQSPTAQEDIDSDGFIEPEYVYEDRPLPSLTTLPKLNKISPHLTLTEMNLKQSDIKIIGPEDACHIERAPKLSIPPTLKFSHYSPDKTNALYVDEGFLGGDHNVFDNLSAIIDGKGNQAMIVTPKESILVTVKTDYGIGLQYSQGKISCSVSQVPPQNNFGSITYYTHNTDLEGKTEPLSIRGRKRDACLTLIDKDNTEYIAVFPKKHDADYMYRLMRNAHPGEPAYTHNAWLSLRHNNTHGIKVSLNAPLNKCENISNAILLNHSPVISTYGITFPSN